MPNFCGRDLRLYTIHAPPEHEPGTIHKTKAEADAAQQAEHRSASHRNRACCGGPSGWCSPPWLGRAVASTGPKRE
jgi:hypothetical protein